MDPFFRVLRHIHAAVVETWRLSVEIGDDEGNIGTGIVIRLTLGKVDLCLLVVELFG